MHDLAPLTEAMRLEQLGDGYRAEAVQEWTFGGRVFGGFLAALATRLAMIARPGLAISELQVVFPYAAKPGPITGRVRPLRQGATSTVLNVELSQKEQPVLAGQAWLHASELFAPPAGAAEPGTITAPEDSPIVAWVAKVVPFCAHFDFRAIDYPLTPDGIGDGCPRCEVWARPSSDLDGLAWAAPVIDLLLFDTFLLECVFRQEGSSAVVPVTLDLSVQWRGHAPWAGWRHLIAEAASSEHFATATAALRDESGALQATATSRGRLFRPTK